MIYGVNSKGHSMVIQIKRTPFINNENKKLVHYCYDFKLDTEGSGNTYEATESGVVIDNYDNDDKQNNYYQFAGLSIEVIEPFRTIRIKFRGYLKNSNNNKLIFTRIRMLWAANSKVYDFQNDFNLSFLSNELSSNESSKITKYHILKDRYAQSGHMRGIIQFESEPEKEIYLWGCRNKEIIGERSNDEIRLTRLMGYSKVIDYC